MSTARVPLMFLIDDDVINLKIAEMFIRHHDVADQIISFTEADQALKYLSENSEDITKLPDIILLDINMPVMDGWEFLDAFSGMKGMLKKQPGIFVVTSSIYPADKEKAFSYDTVGGFVTKPLKKEDLDYFSAYIS
jgi:CheY-like chemotaxis protein